MADGVLRMEEGASGVVRMPVGARQFHIRVPRSEALAPRALAFISNLCQAKLRSRCRAARRPWRRRRSDTKNEIVSRKGDF